MNRPLFASLAALGLVSTATALDLTPQFITTTIDGVPIRHPCFVDGDKKYAVTMDSETELTGYDGTALFNFSKFPRAVMRLGQSPLKPEDVFQGDTLKRYRAAATQLLMQGAEQPQIEQEDAEILPINGWTSRRFTFVYRFTGVPMRESVTFLNLDGKQQIVVQIRAREAEFATISARGVDIIRRWHEVQLEEFAAGN